MDTVEEIKRAIQTLTEEQRRELEVWWHPAYDEWDLRVRERITTQNSRPDFGQIESI